MVRYAIPKVSLVRDDASTVDFDAELSGHQPVYMNFIYTSCTSVCPVMTQTLSLMQDALGPDAANVQIVSVSIDPDYDTPARLQAYARQFNAGPQWHFYTGTPAASRMVQKAFATETVDKMNHKVATFYRPAHSATWIRIDGFASAEELVELYRKDR